MISGPWRGAADSWNLRGTLLRTPHTPDQHYEERDVPVRACYQASPCSRCFNTAWSYESWVLQYCPIRKERLSQGKRLPRQSRGYFSGILPSHAARLRKCLSLVRNARSLAELKRFIHPMSTGSALDGFWAMKVTAQWRLVFRLDRPDIFRDIDYRNYH